MPIYTEEDEPPFRDGEARDGWFVTVLLAEYGELDGAPADAEVPPALNWLLDVPLARRYDFEEAECGLAYESTEGGVYRCTVWDVTGEEDDPWAVFVVDDYGARLLPEYSLFDEDATEEQREATLRRASVEIPARLLCGEFDRRVEEVVPVPDWLRPVVRS